MKKLVFVALVAAAASQAAGCTSDDTGDDVGDDTSSDPQITATIEILNGGPASTIDCVEGDGLRVNARLTDTESGFSDVYDCDVVALVTPPLTTGPGSYDVWVDYINDRGFVDDPDQWVVVETTDYATVEVAGGDIDVDATLTIDHGFFQANWTINGGAETCADFPDEDGVSILSTVAGGSEATDDIFDCEDGANSPDPVFTDPLLLDDYVIDVTLIDANGDAIGGIDEAITNTVLNGNEYVDLGVLDILVP